MAADIRCGRLRVGTLRAPWSSSLDCNEMLFEAQEPQFTCLDYSCVWDWHGITDVK